MLDDLPREVADAVRALSSDYNILDRNDRGANSYVFYALNRVSRQEVVIKFYAGAEGERRHDEPRLLAQVRSTNVLSILDARNASDVWAYFISPRCRGGDLDDLIRNQPSAHEAIDIALGICAGVSAIQASGMLHRDIKPGNIVLEGGVPQIADFGSVRRVSDGADAVVASQHSILYRPPETFATATYTRQSDIYQIGVVTYQLLGGGLSYDGETFLNARQRREYNRILDVVDRSLFVDQAIGRRAAQGTLLNPTTLPPWVTSQTRRVLRKLTAAQPSDRCASLSEAVAQLTQARTSLANWRRTALGALLVEERRVVELEEAVPGGVCEAYLVRPSGRRRAPGSPRGSLPELVAHFS